MPASQQHQLTRVSAEVSRVGTNGTHARVPTDRGAEFLALPAQMGSARLLRKAVVQSCRRCGLDETTCEDFALAVSEAFTNAVQHGTSRPEDRVEAWIRSGQEACSVILEYAGEPFQPGPARLPDDFSTHGRGRYLMSVLADQVEYTFQNGLTRIHLRKRW